MRSYSSEHLREEIAECLDSVVSETDFKVVDELADTKRLRAKLEKREYNIEVDIDIKDEYVSVKHNARDQESLINIKQRFFENKQDAKDGIEDLIVSISEDN